LRIRIPNTITRELSLKGGSFVDIKDKEKDKILDKINDRNIHGIVETNGSVGNEIW
jgi:antitoxin component of MazEF toxin-antitoxin module